MMGAFKLANYTPIGIGSLFQTVNRRYGVFYYSKDPYDPDNDNGAIITPLAPEKLTLLDGWVPVGEEGKMSLSNEDNSTTGRHIEIPFWKPDGTRW